MIMYKKIIICILLSFMTQFCFAQISDSLMAELNSEFLNKNVNMNSIDKYLKNTKWFKLCEITVKKHKKYEYNYFNDSSFYTVFKDKFYCHYFKDSLIKAEPCHYNLNIISDFFTIDMYFNALPQDKIDQIIENNYMFDICYLSSEYLVVFIGKHYWSDKKKTWIGNFSNKKYIFKRII